MKSMDNREGLIQELKEDAKRAYIAFISGVKKACVYTMLVLNVGSIAPKEETKLNAVKDEYKQTLQGQERLEARIDARNLMFSQNIYSPYFTLSAEEKANLAYNEIARETLSENVSLESMIEKVGVSKEDVQTLISQNPEMLSQLIPGKTNISLAKASDKVKGGGEGHCLGGVQAIFDNAGFTGILSGETAQWPDKIRGCRSNSACNAYYPLEKSGKFITVSIANKAYNSNTWSDKNKEMRSFVSDFPAGTIIITENKIADEYQGRSYRDLEKMYGSGGGIHGHIAIKSNTGSYNSDIREISGPNFSKYGENVLISLPKDIQFTREQAKELIKISQERQEKVAQSNTPTYYINYLNMVERG